MALKNMKNVDFKHFFVHKGEKIGLWICVGVMALFARHALSNSTLTALASVADHIALGIDRRRSEDALRLSEARFARLAESGIIGITIANVNGDILESNHPERVRQIAPAGQQGAPASSHGQSRNVHPAIQH